jgi:hypothetical protein
MSDIYFSDYQLKDAVHYFLYIGELKNYGLNIFLEEALSRIENRRFDFISIVPDIFEQYNYENLIVINPEANKGTCRDGRNVSCRIPAPIFLSSVSENPEIKELVQELLRRQGNLYIYMYESMPEMTLDAIPGVSILGPDSNIAFRINSKIYQYQNLKDLVPVADFFICRDLNDLITTTEPLWSKWKDGIFISLEYSAAGVNSMIAHSTPEIFEKFHEEDKPFLISRYMPHSTDPTVLAVVANENDVYIAGVANQRIESGTRFAGSMFPSMLAEKVISTLNEYTRIVGKWLAREGYRGIYGCDFLVDHEKRIFFLEVNARKQGTTMEFCCTLEQSLPAGSAMLPELEYYAVTENRFPENTVEMINNSKNINWGTYNYKVDKIVSTEGYIPQNPHERDAFRKVAKNHLKKDFLILEHIGNDFLVAQDSFLGRIVALGHDQASVQQGLRLGKKTIELTINETIHER